MAKHSRLLLVFVYVHVYVIHFAFWISSKEWVYTFDTLSICVLVLLLCDKFPLFLSLSLPPSPSLPLPPFFSPSLPPPSPDDIEVVFYEDRHDSALHPVQPWTAKGRFGPNDVHHQVRNVLYLYITHTHVFTCIYIYVTVFDYKNATFWIIL